MIIIEINLSNQHVSINFLNLILDELFGTVLTKISENLRNSENQGHEKNVEFCRSRQEFSNEGLVFTWKIGLNTAENGPLKVCQ